MSERDTPGGIDQLRDLLLREMQLRVTNNLVMVSAIATQCLHHSEDVETARMAIAARIEAMLKANSLFSRSGIERASVADVIRGSISAFGMPASRFSLAGARVEVSANAALGLALAMNELGANAAKHGALSNDTGRIMIEWSLERVTGDFTLGWTEQGGPAIAAPKTKGFGLPLIEKALIGSLGGRTQIDFDRDGVTCILSVPLDQLTAE